MSWKLAWSVCLFTLISQETSLPTTSERTNKVYFFIWTTLCEALLPDTQRRITLNEPNTFETLPKTKFLNFWPILLTSVKFGARKMCFLKFSQGLVMLSGKRLAGKSDVRRYCQRWQQERVGLILSKQITKI